MSLADILWIDNGSLSGDELWCLIISGQVAIVLPWQQSKYAEWFVDPTIWFTAQHGSSTTLSCSMWHTTVATYRRYRVLRRESLRVLANQKERSKVTGIAILVNYGNGKTWKSGHFPYPATLCHSPNKRCEDSTKVSKALNSPCENICHEASPGCFSLSSSYALALHKTPGAPSTHLTHPRTSENLKPNFKEDLSKWRFGLCFLRWTCKFVAFVTWLQVRNAFPTIASFS